MELCEITCSIEAMTDEAVLIDDGQTETWLPRSTLHEYGESLEVNKGVAVEISVAYWIAKKKGLI